MEKIPESMQAAILVAQNEPLVVEEVQLPAELRVGQVLVKVYVSGICGSQLGEISGAKGSDPYLPHLMGHEGCARVVDVGPGVKFVQPGDLVVLHWRKGVGIQSDPPVYHWQGQKLNAGWVTTFNTYAVVSENRCTKIPEDTKPEFAALFGCAVTTGFGVVENNANVRIGESVVIYGAGGIGLNMIQAASLVSAYPIIAVDLFNNRLDLANYFGATHVINSTQCDSKSAIIEALNGQDLDVFIDNTGLPSAIELGYSLTDTKGRIVLVGVPRKGNDISIHSLPLHFGKVMTGSHGGETKPDKDIARYMRFLKEKKVSIDQLVTARYPLLRINDALTAMSNGSSAGRVMITL